nr:hypothetical protein [uncultured Bacteroides sp.]
MKLPSSARKLKEREETPKPFEAPYSEERLKVRNKTLYGGKSQKK